MADEPKGVLAQHRERSENEPAYREAAMNAPSITDKTGISAKILDGTAPTVPAARHADAEAPADETSGDEYDALSGEELDAAVRDADIPGRSSMTADEKRQALRDQ